MFIFFLRTWVGFGCHLLHQTSPGRLFGHHLTRFPTKTRQTSAGMRLFTDLDQQGLFSHFGCTRDGSEWQLHEIKSLITESWHRTSKRASSICLCIYSLFVFGKADSIFCFFFPVNTSFPSLSKSIKLFHLLPHRLIRCNLKSKIPDSTISDAIACMFCMAVWIKDWLSLLLSCSNLCPVSLQTGSAEFPEQSGLTVVGRYRLRHLNVLKCKAE